MLVDMLRTALSLDGPAALRYPRGAAVGVALPEEASVLPLGVGEVLVEGADVALVGYGSGVGKALDAAAVLSGRGVDATVADARFAKPLDVELFERLAASHDLLVTVEEGVLAGGFGSGVFEALADTGSALPRLLRIGLPDHFVTHGAPAILHETVGFTGEAIAERIEAALSVRR